MKILKTIVILMIMGCCLISCTDSPNAMQDNAAGEYIVKNNATEFDSIMNTFSFNNFLTENSEGDCFGICMAEKCIFEGKIKGYYNQNIHVLDDLSDYNIKNEWFDDNHKLDFNKVPDNADEKEVLQCINYFQTNQSGLYSVPKFNLKNVIQKLKENSLVIIILQYSNDKSHAVLAYGYNVTSDGKSAKIYIADPNKRKSFVNEISNSIDFKYENSNWSYYYENQSDFKLYVADLNS